MTATVDTLRQLHHLHRQLADLRERLDRGPRQIKAHQGNVMKLETALAEAKQATMDARMTADRKQLQLKTGETKISDLQNKLNTCTTNREYQTLVEQIAADSMANSVHEDEILESLEKIEQLQAEIAASETRLRQGIDELAKTRQAVAAQAELIRGDIARVESELAVVEEQLPIDMRSEYDRIVSTRGDESMAAVEGDCCIGCHTQITPNMINTLMLGQIVTCRACGRMLYLSE